MLKEDTLQEIKGKLQLFKDLIIFVNLIGSAFFCWNMGRLITNTESPIVVVMTGSMEPAFIRGDLLLVTHWKDPL